MLNAERFKKEILEKSNVVFDFSISKDRHTIEKCLGVCDNCIFCNIGEHCSNVKVKWLLSEYKEPVKLTRFEYLLLKLFYKKDFRYLPRGVGGYLYMHKGKNPPQKESGMWFNRNPYITFDVINDLFSFIKWEDEEPKSIKKILNNCEVVESDL